MTKRIGSRALWPAGSAAIIYLFLGIFVFVLLSESNLNFEVYALVVFAYGFIVPTAGLFLEFSGYREQLFGRWRSIPQFAHKGICIFCIFWIIVIMFGGFIPAIKKDYEKR